MEEEIQPQQKYLVFCVTNSHQTAGIILSLDPQTKLIGTYLYFVMLPQNNN